MFDSQAEFYLFIYPSTMSSIAWGADIDMRGSITVPAAFNVQGSYQKLSHKFKLRLKDPEHGSLKFDLYAVDGEANPNEG